MFLVSNMSIDSFNFAQQLHSLSVLKRVIELKMITDPFIGPESLYPPRPRSPPRPLYPPRSPRPRKPPRYPPPPPPSIKYPVLQNMRHNERVKNCFNICKNCSKYIFCYKYCIQILTIFTCTSWFWLTATITSIAPGKIVITAAITPPISSSA